MKNIAYIALGTNIGDRYHHLQRALSELAKQELLMITKVSSIYETDPVGFEDQEPFLNMVIEITTSLIPEQLLDVCLTIEEILGRKRIIRWGPRIIDLDIILFNEEKIQTEKLTIPHPRMHERAFVLIPLLEINPTITLPTNNRLLKDYLNELTEEKGVRVWKQKNGEDVFGRLEN